MSELNYLRNHPIFLCGHPKSGTTLLMSLFDSHPQLIVYPNETFFFRGFVPDIRNRNLEEKISLAQRYVLHFFEQSMNNTDEQEMVGSTQTQRYLDYVRACEIMQKDVIVNGIRHDGDLLGSAVLAFGRIHGELTSNKIYWIEKTPYNEHFAHLIFRWWPEAHCIHIVRDPRDNYASYKRKHPGLSAEDFALGWNSSTKAGLANRERFGFERYSTLRYEDLTIHSEESLQEILKFLDIHDDEILRIPTNDGIPWEGNSLYGDKFRGISAKPVGRWKQELSTRNVEIIETICAEFMEKLGYEIEHKSRIKSYYFILNWAVKQVPALRGDISKLMKKRFGLLPY